MEPIRIDKNKWGTTSYYYKCDECGHEVLYYQRRDGGKKFCIACRKARENARIAAKNEEKIKWYKLSGARDFVAHLLEYEQQKGLEPYFRDVCDDLLFDMYSEYSFKPEKTINDYANEAHTKILYNLVEVMSELNAAEVSKHENPNEWIAKWKNEVLRVIWESLQEAKK